MPTSYETAELSLLSLLSDADNFVVALVGRWGTGKTFLWEKIDQSEPISKRKRVSVSLFGAKSINDLKLRIIEETALKNHPNYKAYAKGVASAGSKLFNKFIPGAFLQDLVLLSFQTLVKDTLIVIDDVERKHPSLETGELMGLINECVERSDARFLLLLNRDELKDRAMWDTLHEKMIDGEIVLEPKPKEAFDVCKERRLCPYPEQVESALTTLGINNIRGINRIARVARKLLQDAPRLGAQRASELIASLTLLTAIHYRIAPDAPTTEYVMAYNSAGHALSKDRSEQEMKWDALLRQLDVSGGGNFEQVLLDYLQSGLLDSQRLNAVLDGYVHSDQADAAKLATDEFFTEFYWGTHETVDSLAERALLLKDHLASINAYSLTIVFDKLKEIGREQVGDQLVYDWIENYNARVSPEDLVDEYRGGTRYRVDDRIQRAIDAKYDQKFPPLPIEEAVSRMRKNRGWGDREKNAFSRMTVAAYLDTLKTLSGDPLGDFVLESLRLMKTSGFADNDPIRIGLDKFKDACAHIFQHEPDSRLSAILRRAFESEGLIDKLLVPPK